MFVRSLTAALAMGATLCFATPLAVAQTASTAPAPTTVRLRGTLDTVSPFDITLKQRNGESVLLTLSDKVVVQEVYPLELSEIKAGSYLGIAAVPMADGSQRALGVTVFPESARGTGDGHRPFDLQPESTMTNATVADLASAPEGRKLRMKYKDGEKAILVPPGTPVVSFRAGDRALLVPGASVSLTVQEIGGKPVVTRVNAGRNGFPIPY